MSRSVSLKKQQRKRGAKRLAVGLGFLAPNILGFLCFTALPLVFALVLAFTNWDLRLHNMFKDEPLKFVGLDNFRRLLVMPDFYRYLGNTLFMMMGIPFGIAGALCSAILLSQDLRGGGARNWRRLIVYAAVAVALVTGGALLLAAGGVPIAGMTLLLGGLVGAVLIGGVVGGSTVYRTLFYLPFFTNGVAVYLLWKRFYSPIDGPVNRALTPVLTGLTGVVDAVPEGVTRGTAWVALAGMLAVALGASGVLRRLWRDGEIGLHGLTLGVLLIVVPAVLGFWWWPTTGLRMASLGVGVFAVGVLAVRAFSEGTAFPAPRSDGFGTGLMLGALALLLGVLCIGLGRTLNVLPAMAAGPDGLTPPLWLSSPLWVKPAMIFMGLWAAVGGNTMLLYLAGLSGVPGELYEAADIDGAGRFARFWHVTWPQLAPVTFFVVVMGVIGGLQGGFEMAKTMTNGGPAGSSTFLSFFIYTEGFETGRLGFAAAITWTLFGLVFLVTIFNWKFGNRYVND